MNEHVDLSAAKRQLLERMLRGGVAGAATADTPDPVRPRSPEAVVPLTAEQRQVWLHALLAPTVPLYNESVTIHRAGSYDHAAMTVAVNELLRRHEAWRTSFDEQDGALTQQVRPHQPLPVPLDDVSHLPETERDAAAIRIATDDARRPIDLAAAPLLRARVVKLAEDDHRLYLTLHHIIFDGVAIYRVIVPELAALYAAFNRDEGSPLDAPALQYGDYAVWQRTHLQSPTIRKQIDYWRDLLKDAPPRLEIPGDRPRPLAQTHAGAMAVFQIPQALTDRLRSLSRREGVTFYMTLLASFHVLLHRYSGEEDIVVGGVTDLRRRPELERVVGYFLNALALRAQPRGDLPFRAFLAEVRDMVAGALAASEAPFDEVVQALGLRREVGRHPLFNIMFSIQPPIDALPQGWRLTQMDVAVGGAKYDLYLELEDRPDGLEARFLYSTELFDAATIDRMIGHWRMILGGIADDPACPIRELPLLTADEDHRLAAEWNDTSRKLPKLMLSAAIAAQIAVRPAAIAIRFGRTSLTYAELSARADAIAAALEVAGVGRGALVAVCLDRSPDMVAALLAVHRVGAAYLPLDPQTPAARLSYIIEDARADLLLADTARAAILPDRGLPRVLIDRIDTGAKPRAAATVSPDDLAYVLYTSGSTGKPKGVEINHGALANLLESMRAKPGFAPNESLLAVTTLSFDIAALELFLPLIAGGTVIVAPRDIAVDPRLLAETIAVERPDMMQATPATWRALVQAGWSGDPRLRILCGGETLPRELADALLARAGELWNVYGPTETTIWSTCARVKPGDGPVPIGRPIDNTTIHILDANGRRVPIGIVGELHIGGDGLARGYRNRPDLTVERFGERPAAPGERLYRTGDLARYRADGEIFCLGRVDHEEKIRGFRVAVEEIEGALADHPDIAAAAVRSWPDASGERSLVAYLVPRADATPDTIALRTYLAGRLPSYMIPARFEVLGTLPMTPNHKIDRKALPEPAGAAMQTSKPPRGVTEQKLAAIWCALLGIDSIDRHANFFDLGGHSLLVAQLLARIERDWGRRMEMAEFFQVLTLADLAARIEQTAPAAVGTLVPLQPHGHKLPLLWLDAGPRFRDLALATDPDRPFLGLGLGPILDTAMQGDMSIESVARQVIDEIRAARPEGPYLIGGWCTFGILAYEVARQMRAAGDDVPLVAMGHSINPAAYARITRTHMRISKARYHFGIWRRLPWAARWRYAIDRARGVLEDVGIAEADTGGGAGRIRTAALEHAAYDYRPAPYSGDVALFQPIDRLDVLDTEPGWREIVDGSLTCFDVPGSHETITDAPNVTRFAHHLREALDRAGQ